MGVLFVTQKHHFTSRSGKWRGVWDAMHHGPVFHNNGLNVWLESQELQGGSEFNPTFSFLQEDI